MAFSAGWKTDSSIPPKLSMAFAPVQKRALGTAVGLTFGGLIFILTAFHLLLRPANAHAPDLSLLAQYFYGYRVTWVGACWGLFWGFVSGFVMGWFIGFARNLTTALWIFFVKTKTQLAQPFLDHI